ncbi:MAG: pyridoxamine 5'-phosphate oxidase family protein [Gammaproteobacteria bacterium]|nr:pyridoxamine 5'-phosphate oxidase family protein [Gammaproteobacteria bacterium]
MQKITSLEMLEQRYATPVSERAMWKEIDHIDDLYRQFIEASPFLILSTHGERGVDCSPHGDPPGFVRVAGPHCLQIPDRKGNNRLDSMRNIIDNSQVGIIFLIPNVGETIRVSGSAEILVDDALCESFAVNGKPASSVLSVTVQKAYYQCQKALVRSRLWDPEARVERDSLPTAGQMAQHFSARHGQAFDGLAYDEGYSEYMRKNMY